MYYSIHIVTDHVGSTSITDESFFIAKHIISFNIYNNDKSTQLDSLFHIYRQATKKQTPLDCTNACQLMVP